MLVKNISTRGWHVGGSLIKPLETIELDDALKADIKDNAELEIVESKKETKSEKADIKDK